MQPISSRSVFGVFWRQRRIVGVTWAVLLAVGVTWAVLLAVGVAWTCLTPNVYQSFVRLGRENVTLDPTANLGRGSMSAVPQLREQEINTVVETLRSRLLIGQAVDLLTPVLLQDVQAESGSAREAAVEKFATGYEVMAVRKSNLISISCEARDPDLAGKMVAAIVDRFFADHRSLNRTPGAGRFFTEHAELLGTQLRETEAEILRGKNRVGVVSVGEQKNLLLAQNDALQQDVHSTEARATETEAAIAELQAQLEMLPEELAVERTEGHANTAADSMRERLFGLELRESELAARMTDAHPQLQEIREQLAAARAIQGKEKESRSQIKRGRNPAHEKTQSALLARQADLAAFKARLASRRVHLDSAREQLLALNDAESQLAQLERELELRRGSYEKYCQSLEQTRIDEALEAGRISNISVAEPPTISHRPVRPNRGMIFSLSLLGATVVALIAGLCCRAT